jgi:hypothetical protein
LASRVLARLDELGWPAGDARRQLTAQLHILDNHYLSHNLDGVRQAGEAALALIDEHVPPVAQPDGDAADQDAWICRVIERSEGLPAGSLELWTPHLCCWCCRAGGA